MKDLRKSIAQILVCGAKANWLEICQDLLKKLRTEQNFLDPIMTEDRPSANEYVPETKLLSEQ